MHPPIENSTMIVRPVALLVLGMLLISAGCNQQRYKPAPWRAAARKTTLPVDEASSTRSVRWTSLPMTRMGSLPMRNAGQSTLPNRGFGGTLPNRGGFGGTLPLRNWSTLPGRDMTTLPSRGGGMNTLPQRQLYPEYRQPRRNWTTLPQSGAQQPRWIGTTLPR